MDLSDVRFQNAQEVRKLVDNWIASKDEEFFRGRINQLPEGWQEVLVNDGQYIG